MTPVPIAGRQFDELLADGDFAPRSHFDALRAPKQK